MDVQRCLLRVGMGKNATISPPPRKISKAWADARIRHVGVAIEPFWRSELTGRNDGAWSKAMPRVVTGPRRWCVLTSSGNRGG